MSNYNPTPEEYNELPAGARAFIDHLRNDNLDLYAQIRDQPPREEKYIKPPKLNEPTAYDGTRNSRMMEDYLYDLKQQMDNDPVQFKKEDTKIRFAGSFLKDNARTWFRTMDKLENWTTYNEFVEKLTKHFSEIDPEEHWRKRWDNLQQRGSITTYLSEFESVAAHISLTDEDKYHQFRKGLRSNVLDQLVLQERPDSLEKLITLANQIDGRLWEQTKARNHAAPRIQASNGHRTMAPQRPPFQPRFQGNNNGYRSSNLAQGKNYQRYVPKTTFPNNMPLAPVAHPRWVMPADDRMQLDTMHKGPISATEKQRRYNNHLCLYCGEMGHTHLSCPAKMNGPQRPHQGKPKN